jgi:hypothetical protein
MLSLLDDAESELLMTGCRSRFTCCRRSIFGLVFGLALLVCASADAQNLLQNGDFEQPLGPTNWTVRYLIGGSDDWEIKDRSRGGSRRAAWYGGYFRVVSQKLAHAYFTQTVTNLTPDHVYDFVGHMKEDWWKGVGDPKRDRYLVYMELIGGQGSPLECGDNRFSIIATNDLTNSDGDPETDIDPPYTYPTAIWRPFFAQQTPDANGRIEIRLHYNKVGYTTYDKPWISAASFDDLFLTP